MSKQIIRPISLREFFKSLYFALAPKGSRLYSLTHTTIRQFLNKRYKFWIKHFDSYSQEDFQEFSHEIANLSSQPLISILMPVFNPNLDFLNQAIQSVRDQVYPWWELSIADDASTLPGVRETIHKHCHADQRIKAIYRASNGHISAASNSALSLATGEYVALLDHDDMLHPLALYHVAKEINKHPESVVIYSDEDKITPRGKRIDPYFKSDFDHELFLSQNMVSHLGVYQREMMTSIGGFRTGVEGSQDYDLLLRILPKIDRSQIRHIPKVLYHWRISAQSVADRIDIKPYALEAGKKALADYLATKKIPAAVNTFENFGYKISYKLPEPSPKVELIFITQEPVEQFLEGYRALVEQAQADFSHIAIYILASETSRNAIEDYQRKVLPNFKLRFNDLEGNIAGLLNQLISESSADYIGLINDACIQASPNWLGILTSLANQPGIGCVSPKLVDKKGDIFACGLILTEQYFAQRLFKGQSDTQLNHYFGWSSLHKGYSALPSACLVFNRSRCLSLGGFDPELSNYTARCIDLCLKMSVNGFRNLVVPETIMTIDKIPGQQTIEGLINNEHDKDTLLRRYKKWFEDDPAFNPNLTLLKGKPSVSKKPRKSSN